MSNKLYKEDPKKKKKKETDPDVFMGRIIYGCALGLIAMMLIIVFAIPSNINEKRVFIGYIIAIIIISIFAIYGIALVLLSKHSTKFQDWSFERTRQFLNLTPPKESDNIKHFVIYRPKFYKGLSFVTVIVGLGMSILCFAYDKQFAGTIFSALVFISLISAVHTFTYKITIENEKITYKWLLAKEKSIGFSEIGRVKYEDKDNCECAFIYKKDARKPFIKINMMDLNANLFRHIVSKHRWEK